MAVPSRLDDANLNSIQADAKEFWEQHRLIDIVSDTDFVIGAMIYFQPDEALSHIEEPSPATPDILRSLTHQHEKSIEIAQKSGRLGDIGDGDTSYQGWWSYLKSKPKQMKALRKGHWTILAMGSLAAFTQ
jgi:hypothetical protein